MTGSARLAAAYALDWAAGDPPGFPHPVRFMGAAVSAGERCLRRSAGKDEELLRGAALTVTVVAASWWLSRRIARASEWAEVVLAWTTLATRSLLDESRRVVDAVEAGELQRARHYLSRIVGRDTAMLEECEILRAVIETLAEGLCDGIVAPLLYLTVGGTPAAVAFKAVSTLDSMIGHREVPYLYFGRVAARLDDGANWIPARVSAMAIVAAAAVAGADAGCAWRVWRADGGKHPSPNAGQSEAAMAGALGVRLGGMNFYGGQPAPKPLLGAGGPQASCRDARAALRIAGVASMLVFSAAWLCLRLRERRA